MKIIYIDFLYQAYASQWRVHLLAKHLIEQKHEVKIIDLQETLSGNIIIRRLRMIHKLFANISSILMSDVLIVVNPYCFSWFALFLKLINKKYMLDAVDKQDSSEVMKLINAGIPSRIMMFIHCCSLRFWLLLAYKVCSNNMKMLTMASTKYIHLLYDPLPFNISKPNHDFTNRTTVGWIGSDGTKNMISNFEIGNELKKHGLDFVTINNNNWSLDKIKYDVPKWLCGLNLYPQNAKLDGRFACKIMFYAAAGIPIVSTKHGEIANLKKQGLPVVIIDSKEELIESILCLFYNKEKAKLAGETSRKIFEEKYCIAAQFNKYVDFLKS